MNNYVKSQTIRLDIWSQSYYQKNIRSTTRSQLLIDKYKKRSGKGRKGSVYDRLQSKIKSKIESNPLY